MPFILGALGVVAVLIVVVIGLPFAVVQWSQWRDRRFAESEKE